MKGIGRREVVPFSYSIQIIRSGSQIRDFGAVDIVASTSSEAEEEASKTDAFAKSVSSAVVQKTWPAVSEGENQVRLASETRDPAVTDR